MANDRVQRKSTNNGSLVNHKAELIRFPKDRVVRTRAMQRRMQPLIERYITEVRVSPFVAFCVARAKFEGDSELPGEPA